MKLKTKYLYIIFGLFVIGSCKQEKLHLDCSEVLSNWKISSFICPVKHWQSDMYFPSKEVGYLVGDDASILKTEDSGESWRIINTADSKNSIFQNNLSSVYFIDKDNGFVGGESYLKPGDKINPGAILLKTNDGGQTWTKKYFKNYFKFKDIRFANPNDGLAIVADVMCTWKMSLVSTNDGGNSWNPVILPFKRLADDNLFEISDYIGVRCSEDSWTNFLYVSNNGGKSWKTISLPNKSEKAYFIDSNIGFATGGIDYKTYQTEDGGNSWQISTVPFRYSSIIHFKNKEEGFIINSHEEYIGGGGECATPSLIYYEAYETKDAGKTWIMTQVDKNCDITGNLNVKGGDAFYNIGYSGEYNSEIVNRYEEK